jgi:hypothetical protein
MNNALRINAFVVSIVIGVASAVASLSVNAANRCTSPTFGAEARACAADREGPEALRRFINRTRTIYQFYYWDFRSPEPAAGVAQNAGRSVVQAQSSTNGTAR